MLTKKMYWLLPLLLVGIFSLVSSAQAHPLHQTGPAIGATTAPVPEPVVARVYFADQADVNRLAATLDVWEVHHSGDANQRYLVALLTPQQSDNLRARGYRLEIDPEKTALLSQQPVAVAGLP